VTTCLKLSWVRGAKKLEKAFLAGVRALADGAAISNCGLITVVPGASRRGTFTAVTFTAVALTAVALTAVTLTALSAAL
jgi:hypothetical protein